MTWTSSEVVGQKPSWRGLRSLGGEVWGTVSVDHLYTSW